VRGDLAATYFNLANAQIGLKDFRSAADSAQRARDMDASIYGDDHLELVVDELRLAETLSAAGDLDAARAAISRCLNLIRQGAPMGGGSALKRSQLPSMAAGLAQRARIVLLAADGVGTTARTRDRHRRLAGLAMVIDGLPAIGGAGRWRPPVASYLALPATRKLKHTLGIF
jgi:hypothetical protein